MSAPSTQSAFEKSVSAFLFVLLTVIGWAPFLWAEWREPYASPPLLMIAAAGAMLSLGLLYDAVEKLAGEGKGLYAAAIFVCFAPAGAVIADSAFIAIVAFQFIFAATLWLAARAEGDNRPYMLAMLAVLLLIAGYFFSFFVIGVAFLFAIALAGWRGFGSPWKAAWLVVPYIVGSALRTGVDLGVPRIIEIPATKDLPFAKALLLQLPWLLLVIPLVERLLRKKPLATWQRGALIVLALLYAGGLLTGTDALVIGAAAAPILMLSGGDLLARWFALRQRDGHGSFSLTLVLTALAALTLPAVRVFHLPWFNAPSQTAAFIAIFFATLLLLLAFRKLPRWSFAALCAAGLLFGSLWWVRASLLTMDDPIAAEPSEPIWPTFIPLLLVMVLLVVRKLYGRRMPGRAMRDGPMHMFSHENFRRFSNPRRREWEGELVDVADRLASEYRFAIFGDITGADFPIGSRRGGYFIYRALAEEISRQQADFAISVGDLSTCAGVAAYRRLRQMLRHIRAPLAVSPGNHDLFSEEDYYGQYFHALFGADNSTFELHGVRYILLNNARGHLDAAQYDWLRHVLREGKARATFVFCHKPVFDPRADEFYGMENRESAQQMHDLFKQEHVTAVFSGHIHALLNFERDGVKYIISGGGGSKLDSGGTEHHFLLADVNENGMTLRALPLTRTRDAQRESRPLLELFFPFAK